MISQGGVTRLVLGVRRGDLSRWCHETRAASQTHRHSRVPGAFTEVRRRQRECHRDRFGLFSLAKADASNPVVATWPADQWVEGRPDQETGGHGAQALTEEAAAAWAGGRAALP